MRILDFVDGFESGTPSSSVSLPASDVSNTPSGNLSSDNVQDALNELQADINAANGDLTAIESDILDLQSDVSDVQTAIDELASDAATNLANHESDTTNIHGITDTSLLVTTTGTQTLINKTLNSPAITTPTGILKSDVGLGNVDNTSDSTKNSASVTLTNKTISTASNTIQSGAASNGQVLTANGSGGTSWASPAAARTLIPANVQRFTSGSGTYNRGYAFVITTGSATTGATYTNNGNTYTILETVSSGTLIYLSGTADPTASGTLTKSGGVGDTTLTFTESAKPIQLHVSAWGGGGSGTGSGTASATNGTAGTPSTFGTSLLSAGGGGVGNYQGAGGTGGTNTINSPAKTVKNIIGGNGDGYMTTSAAVAICGGSGGVNPLGGSSGQTTVGNAGLAGATNTGAGGGGGATNNTSSNYRGSGGGAGGYLEAIINSPSATYSYVVGAAGSPSGVAGTNGFGGGAGGSGCIVVEERYQ